MKRRTFAEWKKLLDDNPTLNNTQLAEVAGTGVAAVRIARLKAQRQSFPVGRPAATNWPALFEANLNAKYMELAQMVGCGTSAVCYQAKKLGLTKGRAPKQARIAPKIDSKIHRSLGEWAQVFVANKDLDMVQIAKKIGVTKQAVWQAWHRLKLPKRRRRKAGPVAGGRQHEVD